MTKKTRQPPKTEPTTRQPVESPTMTDLMVTPESIDTSNAPVDDFLVIPEPPTIVELITNRRELANMDLDLKPINTRAGFSIAKADAVEELKKLEKQYAATLKENGVALILTGSKAQAFADAAKELEGVVVLDAAKVYEELAQSVEPSMQVNSGPMVFDTPQFLHLISALTELGGKLDINSMMRPRFENAVCETHADVVVLIRRLVEATCGTELSALSLRRDLFDQALASGFIDMVPILILNGSNTEELTQNLLQTPSRAMTLEVEDDPTEDAVVATLMKLAAL